MRYEAARCDCSLHITSHSGAACGGCRPLVDAAGTAALFIRLHVIQHFTSKSWCVSSGLFSWGLFFYRRCTKDLKALWGIIFAYMYTG